MKRKKFIYLVMSCNNEFFIDEEQLIKETWAKDILENKYDADIIFYRGDENINYDYAYDSNEHLLTIKCEDDIKHTFKKTYLALKYINNKYDYDFIIRTNTSTYLNIPLINEICNKQNKSYCGLAVYNKNVVNPICFTGKFYILNNETVKTILANGKDYLYGIHNDICEYNGYDDYVISYIINKQTDFDIHKSFENIICLPIGFYNTNVGDYNNPYKLCAQNCKLQDFEFWKKFPAIILKYQERESIVEYHNFLNVYNTFNNHSDDCINETVDFCLEYSKNPSILLIENTGYINLSDILV